MIAWWFVISRWTFSLNHQQSRFTILAFTGQLDIYSLAAAWSHLKWVSWRRSPSPWMSSGTTPLCWVCFVLHSPSLVWAWKFPGISNAAKARTKTRAGLWWFIFLVLGWFTLTGFIETLKDYYRPGSIIYSSVKIIERNLSAYSIKKNCLTIATKIAKKV